MAAFNARALITSALELAVAKASPAILNQVLGRTDLQATLLGAKADLEDALAAIGAEIDPARLARRKLSLESLIVARKAVVAKAGTGLTPEARAFLGASFDAVAAAALAAARSLHA